MQTRLTPEQIQVIKMIECPNIELEERIQKELMENPVLEIGEDEPEEKQQEGIDVKIPEGQTLQGFDEVIEIPLGRENLGWNCHGFCLGFEAGQQHPGKGEDHGDAARD